MSSAFILQHSTEVGKDFARCHECNKFLSTKIMENHLKSAHSLFDTSQETDECSSDLLGGRRKNCFICDELAEAVTTKSLNSLTVISATPFHEILGESGSFEYKRGH